MTNKNRSVCKSYSSCVVQMEKSLRYFMW